MPQEGKKTEQLFLWKKEAFNYRIHLCQECCSRFFSIFFNLEIKCMLKEKKKGPQGPITVVSSSMSGCVSESL